MLNDENMRVTMMRSHHHLVHNVSVFNLAELSLFVSPSSLPPSSIRTGRNLHTGHGDIIFIMVAWGKVTRLVGLIKGDRARCGLG